MSSLIDCNPTLAGLSCMYSAVWAQKNASSTSWMTAEDDFYSSMGTTSLNSRISAPSDEKDEMTSSVDCFGGEKNRNKKSRGYKHVPHKDKPALVVEKRNARERRRVQAVNNAFLRLRKAVPVENHRGKRISKVKTLLYAMDYIEKLQKLLEQDINYQQLQVISHFYSHKSNNQDYFIDDFSFQDEL